VVESLLRSSTRLPGFILRPSCASHRLVSIWLKLQD
jgi:hypothetical protein